MKSLTRGHVKAGLDSLRTTKWRNFWTMLGVIIGVASVISVVGIGDGIKQQISAQLRQTQSNDIVVRPGALNGNGTNPLSGLSGFSATGTLSAHDASIVQVTPGVRNVAPMNALMGRVQGDQSKYQSGLVIGTTPALPSLLNQVVANGSFITSDTSDSNVVVLGSQAASDLFNEDVPLGHSLTINGQQFTVVGIMSPFSNAPLSQDANYNKAVFIPYDQAIRLTNNTASTFEIIAAPNNPQSLNHTARAVDRALTVAHGGQTDFSVMTANQSLTASNNILALLTQLITGIAAISLIVGGVGIMNVMLVSVTERMHEIGIRKAIGATNKQILSQFLIESSTLSLTGGIIGIIVSFIIDLVLRLLTTLTPDISWQTVVAALGVSLVIGIVFGSIPALNAARKDPISALRAD